jgi:hypothetical protein
MSIQEVPSEQLARVFHRYHQALAPSNRAGDPVGEIWDHVPAQEKSRLIAAARLALLELAGTVHEREASRQYFAEPGEAEWGC